jgi:type IV pilus assembly protein PilQ
LQTLAPLNLIGQFFVKVFFMFSSPKLTTINRATAAAALLMFGLTACQQPTPQPPPPPPKVIYSETYDREIKEIMDLARQNRWEEAQTRATALYNQDPKNQILARVRTWVDQQTQAMRAKALEDKIRSIDAGNSAFDPTIMSLITEQKDRGLPPRKDVRDAIDRIENTPYIPDTYGKTVHEEGPLFDFESEKGRMAKVLEKEVTIHLDNVPLETILVNLSQSSGVNIVADKSLAPLKQVLSINLDNVKLSELFRYIGRNYELQFQVGDELVWVVDAKDPKRLMEETRFYRLRKGFVLPAEFGAPEAVKTTTTAANQATTVTEVQKFQKFVNDMAPVLPSIERAITNLFSGSKAFIDYEHNLIVARGTPEQLNVIENIIKEFDKPIQQVLIEARFITVSKPAFLQLGVLWEADRQSQSVGVNNSSVPQDFTGLVNGQNFPNSISANPAAIISGANPAVGIGIQQAFTRVFGADNLTATISALEQSGESQTLSAPRLTVLNNRPATISDGNVQYYYEEYSVASTVGQYYTVSSWVPSGKPTKITAGAVLNVLASISGDGKSILLALNPIVNTDVQLVKYATLSQYGVGTNVQSSFDIKLPTYRTEELSTRVTVKSGQTVVMGGVLQRERSTMVESVPVLGDIPIIGALFRRRTESDTPRYLLIFVTATIVKDNGEFLVYDDTKASTNSVAAPK